MFLGGLITSLAIGLLVGAAGAVVTRRWWQPYPWLAPAYGLLALGIASHIAWAICWWSRVACLVFGVAVVLTALLIVARARRDWRGAVLLVSLVGAVTALLVGHASLWGQHPDPFWAMALRYRSMPGDNYLQYLFAYDLWNNISTVQFYSDWNGSDRPPLQSGFLLLSRGPALLAGIRADVPVDDLDAEMWGLGASIAAQLVWVPGMFALLRSLRFRVDVAVLTTAFVTVLPLTIYNTTFTWPKMMSAGFVLAACAILVTLILERPVRATLPLVSSGLLFVLGYLSHAGAAFVVPALIALALIALRGRGLRQYAVQVGINVSAAVLVYVPWWAYGKWADPYHARLLKWHLAGVIPVDDRTFLQALKDAYTSTPMRDLVNARKVNLQFVFNWHIGQHTAIGGFPGSWREMDFFFSTFAIGAGAVLLLGMMAGYVVGWMLRQPVVAELRISLWLIVACLLCMVAWALVLFIPGGATVHAGTYVWLLVFASLSFAWLARCRPWLALVVLFAQASYAGVVYAAPGPDAGKELSWRALLLTIVGTLWLCGLVVAAFASLLRCDRPRTPTDAPRSRSVGVPA